jgi:hypothetical protein
VPPFGIRLFGDNRCISPALGERAYSGNGRGPSGAADRSTGGFSAAIGGNPQDGQDQLALRERFAIDVGGGARSTQLDERRAALLVSARAP